MLRGKGRGGEERGGVGRKHLHPERLKCVSFKQFSSGGLRALLGGPKVTTRQRMWRAVEPGRMRWFHLIASLLTFQLNADQLSNRFL